MLHLPQSLRKRNAPAAHKMGIAGAPQMQTKKSERKNAKIFPLCGANMGLNLKKEKIEQAGKVYKLH